MAYLFILAASVAITMAVYNSIHESEKTIMAALDDLKREVQEQKTVHQSVVALLQSLKQKLDDAIASGNDAALQALADELDTQEKALADAVVANTPAATEQPV